MCNIRNPIQFGSVAQSCLTLCDPMDCIMPGLPVHHQLPEFTQTHVHRVGDAIQPSRPLSSRSPPAFYILSHASFCDLFSCTYTSFALLSYEHTERLLFLGTAPRGCLRHSSFSLCPPNGFFGSFQVLPIGSGCRDCPRIPSCVSVQQNKQVGW